MISIIQNIFATFDRVQEQLHSKPLQKDIDKVVVFASVLNSCGVKIKVPEKLESVILSLLGKG
jgi:hypothetical protein